MLTTVICTINLIPAFLEFIRHVTPTGLPRCSLTSEPVSKSARTQGNTMSLGNSGLNLGSVSFLQNFPEIRHTAVSMGLWQAVCSIQPQVPAPPPRALVWCPPGDPGPFICFSAMVCIPPGLQCVSCRYSGAGGLYIPPA